MAQDTTIGVPRAEAEAAATEPEDDGVVTVYTHDGDDWVPIRLGEGDATTVLTAEGRPVAKVEVDKEVGSGD